jgi:NADPH2:quinone reductase
MFVTDDIARQHEILNKIARLLDAGTLKTTLTTTLNGFTVK